VANGTIIKMIGNNAQKNDVKIAGFTKIEWRSLKKSSSHTMQQISTTF